MEQCIFCEIVKGTIPSYTVYETDTVKAFLDINPVNPGHTLVIPKTHYRDFSDAPSEVVADLVKTVHKITPAVVKAVGAEAFNLGVNSGRDAGQIIFHLHWHIMPRFPNDGHHLWKGKAAYAEKLPELATKIRQTII